ncbi:MAG: helix-turn-helix domain-containing protein [Mycolicibacterium frederiksbergense]|nr:helix-turn-helix domain-containing protein [Mycolicibacterium frederiksbergense]
MAKEVNPAVAAVGRRIAHCRRLRGWTQDKLAFAVGLSRPTIANFERGRHDLLLRSFLDMADALNVDPCDLLYDPKPGPRISGMTWYRPTDVNSSPRT